MVEVQRFTAKEKIKREYKLLDNSVLKLSRLFCVYVHFYTGETPGQGCRASPGKEGWKRGHRCKCCVSVCLWLPRLYNTGLTVYSVWLTLCADLEILILVCVCPLMTGNGPVCHRGATWRKRHGVVSFVCFSGLLDTVD